MLDIDVNKVVGACPSCGWKLTQGELLRLVRLRVALDIDRCALCNTKFPEEPNEEV